MASAREHPVVEVTAGYGDVVVASRRVGGPPPPSTRPLGVGLSLVGLGIALAVAEIASRGALVTLPLDGALAGLVLALVGLVLASVGWHRRGEPDRTAFWLGQHPTADVAVAVPGLDPDARLPVVRRTDAGIELALAPGVTGEIVRDGQAVDLAELVQPGEGLTAIVPFDGAERARLRCGDLLVDVRPADGVPAPPRARVLDLRFAAATALAALLVGGTILVAFHVMPDSRTLPDEEDRPVVYPPRFTN